MKAAAKVFFTLIMAAHTTHAAAVKRPPHLSADEFIVQIHAFHDNRYVNAGTQYGQHYARGYLAGVADVSQGVTWCAPVNLSVGLTDQQVIDDLAKRPRATMPAIASAQLLTLYAARHPMTATACDFAPRLTGDQFVVWLIGDLKQSGVTKQNQSADASLRQRYAEGYIGGVIDATQGSRWCATRRIKPDELDARGAHALLDQTAHSMPGNAAMLLLQQFIANFPCSRP